MIRQPAAEGGAEATNPRLEVVCRHGTCLQCGGEGGVPSIAADPLDLSLCGNCPAFLIRDAAGIRSAIRERWLMMNRRVAAQEARRRAELERKARADVERVLKMDEGNGLGCGCSLDWLHGD